MKIVFGSHDVKLSDSTRHNQVMATYTETGNNCPLSCKFHPDNDSPYRCYSMKGNMRFHSQNNAGIDAQYLRARVSSFLTDRANGKKYATRITVCRMHVSGDVINADTKLPDVDYIEAVIWACDELTKNGINVLGYTHAWMYDEVTPLQKYFMASCDDYDTIPDAQARGWMCTTTKPKEETQVPDGVKLASCPNQITDGRIKCIDCMLCSPSKLNNKTTKRVMEFKLT